MLRIYFLIKLLAVKTIMSTIKKHFSEIKSYVIYHHAEKIFHGYSQTLTLTLTVSCLQTGRK